MQALNFAEFSPSETANEETIQCGPLLLNLCEFLGAKVKAGGRTQKTKHTHILRKSTADFWATLLWLSLVAVVVLAMADFFMIMCLIARGGYTILYHTIYHIKREFLLTALI